MCESRERRLSSVETERPTGSSPTLASSQASYDPSMSNGPVYPPERHVLRDLGFEIEVLGATEQRAHLVTADAGSIGAVATVADVLGGSLCLGVVAPDWMATSSLALRWAGPVAGAGLVMDARLLRAGRRHVTVEVTLRAERGGMAGQVVGDALLCFSRLERREANLDLSERRSQVGARFGFERSDAEPLVPFDSALGAVEIDASLGLTETPVTTYLRNSFGAVNGGVVAALAGRAATCAVAATTGATEAAVGVADLVVHHLGQGREGPVRTRVCSVAVEGSRHLQRVELHDAGLLDDRGVPRLMAVAHVGLTVAGS